MKLKDLIKKQFESVELDGVSNIMLDAECETFEEVESGRTDKKVFKVRFAGYDKPTTHPLLRNPKTDDYFNFVFFSDEEWYFEEC